MIWIPLARPFLRKGIKDGDQLAKTWMYVKQNPVKAKLAPTSGAWKWSSAYFRENSLRSMYLVEPDWLWTKVRNTWWSTELLDEETLNKVRKSIKPSKTDTIHIEWDECAYQPQ